VAESKTCPNCGHCDKCGRSNFRPWQPYWTYPYWSVQPPYYVGDVPNTYQLTTWGTSSGTNIC